MKMVNYCKRGCGKITNVSRGNYKKCSKVNECKQKIWLSVRVNVPNIIGLYLDNAKSVLQRNGLRVGKISRILSAEQNKNKVINQTPKSGTVNRGTSVNLIVGE